MSATPMSHAHVQLVKADGTTINLESVEYFGGSGMIWLRGQNFEQGSIVEVFIDGDPHTVKAIENKEQFCEIRLERE
ncbi:hypothetical protein PQQ51_33955 [Paraburkholderia xenovorans]|uniref:hypothetical protein n=1 Tax=Paraburkholderia xenovorans TaxID=36873 RepID=UPI0038BC2081